MIERPRPEDGYGTQRKTVLRGTAGVASLLLSLAICDTYPIERPKPRTSTKIAVLDFDVFVPGVRSSAILGRSATDAVVIEMTRSGRYDVTPRTQLNQLFQDLELTQPHNNEDVRKLGRALGAGLVASGEIWNIGHTDRPRRAKVTLTVRLTDVVSGEVVNGAIETGYSPVSDAGSDERTQIAHAVWDAAYNSVTTLKNFTVPKATILLTTADEVSLNRGSRDGLQTGQEFVVTRGKDSVGKIQLMGVSATASLAKITDPGKGIRPDDKAQAVFKLPGYGPDEDCDIISSTVPPPSRSHGPVSGY